MSVMFVDEEGGVTSLTFVTSATAGATGPGNGDITVPVGAAAGDLAVLFDACSNTPSGSVTDVTPTGWTRAARHSLAPSFETENVVSYKVLTSGDLGATVTGMSQDDQSKVMLIFRPDAPITTVTSSTWVTEGQGTAQPAQQTVSASGQPAPLLVLGHAAASALPTFSTQTPAFDAEFTVSTTGYDLRVGYKIYNSSPANHSIRSNDPGDANVLMTGYLAVS